MELLIGAGSSHVKKLSCNGKTEWEDLVTLDSNPDHHPNVVWNLNELPLPFHDDTFDEIHAYEVLEHLGSQGDWRFFFGQFSDFWRMLKPGGLFIGTVPYWQSVWAFADPSHTRVIPPETFTFLVQPEYTKQVGVTPMSDFRFCYKEDFDILHLQVNASQLTEFVLQAVNPSRIDPSFSPIQSRPSKQKEA